MYLTIQGRGITGIIEVDHIPGQYMKQCPYCGSDLPNDKTVICIKCSHIIDEDFLLRKEIKKELESMHPTKMKAKTKKNHTRPSASGNKRDNGNFVPKYYDEKKSYANIILIVIVVIIILYMTFK